MKRKLSITIEAGQAFGSGEHPSTEGALMLLHRLTREMEPKKILDMGCGSGILSVSAAMLWPGCKVMGVDINPEAEALLDRNWRVNQLAQAQYHFIQSDMLAHPAIEEAGPYDLILCNMTAEPLILLADGLVRLMSNNGRLILSGILMWRESDVTEAYRHAGAAVVDHAAIREWRSLLLKKS